MKLRLNDDLGAPVIVRAAALDWVQSPASGIERRPLFRIGAEIARATSIVRYAPGSRFPRHTHPGGEEFLVLQGTFQDETGEYPAGTYVRNPPGSAHSPGSDAGCILFVKLWQFRKDDRERVLRLPGEGEPAAARSGVLYSLVMFHSAYERVMMEEWRAGARVELPNSEGLELLVLEGGFVAGAERLEPLSWLRLPPGHALDARVDARGARVWYKLAPLLHNSVCTFEDEPLSS